MSEITLVQIRKTAMTGGTDRSDEPTIRRVGKKHAELRRDFGLFECRDRAYMACGHERLHSIPFEEVFCGLFAFLVTASPPDDGRERLIFHRKPLGPQMIRMSALP